MPAWLIKLLWQATPWVIGAAGVWAAYLYRKKARTEADKAKRYKQIAEASKAAAVAMARTETEKTQIREKYEKLEADIVNNPSVDHGVMPIDSRKHNHSFRDPCGPGCPAYRGDGRIY